MGKIAFVFPGQGAQVVGMGQNVYENSAVAKDVFEQASKAVDLDLKALCFEENNDINITEFTQVCLLTTSVAIMEELKTRGVKADVAAGLSLGEYTAHIASGSMIIQLSQKFGSLFVPSYGFICTGSPFSPSLYLS